MWLTSDVHSWYAWEVYLWPVTFEIWTPLLFVINMVLYPYLSQSYFLFFFQCMLTFFHNCIYYTILQRLNFLLYVVIKRHTIWNRKAMTLSSNLYSAVYISITSHAPPMIGDTNDFMCYLLPSQWMKTLSFTLSQILGTGVLQSLQELSACCRTWQMGQQTTVSRVWLLCVACLAKCVMVLPPNFLLLNQNPNMALM